MIPLDYFDMREHLHHEQRDAGTEEFGNHDLLFFFTTGKSVMVYVVVPGSIQNAIHKQCSLFLKFACWSELRNSRSGSSIDQRYCKT